MSQIYAPGDTATFEFPISSATGAAVNADSAPTMRAYKNGTLVADSVTISNPSTGRYVCSFAIPGTYAARDEVRITAQPVVGGITLPETTVFRTRLDVSVSIVKSETDNLDDSVALALSRLQSTFVCRLTIDTSVGFPPILDGYSDGFFPADNFAGYVLRNLYHGGSFLTVSYNGATGEIEAVPIAPNTATLQSVALEAMLAADGSKFEWFLSMPSTLSADVSGKIGATNTRVLLALPNVEAGLPDGGLPLLDETGVVGNVNVVGVSSDSRNLIADATVTKMEASGTKLTVLYTRFLSMIEQIGTSGLWRFVTGALTQAPSGGGGPGALTPEQEEILQRTAAAVGAYDGEERAYSDGSIVQVLDRPDGAKITRTSTPTEIGRNLTVTNDEVP